MFITTRTRLAATVLAAAGLALTGCSNDSSASGSTGSSPSTSAGTSQSTSGTTVAVTVRGDQVTPNGKRLKEKVGEPVTITVDADRAGELHVHSTPEQELAYKNGKTTLHVTIDKPGIVDIEDHIADVVVVQLEVS